MPDIMAWKFKNLNFFEENAITQMTYGAGDNPEIIFT